jgi:DNA-binding Lrp family transcriptional regulator
MIAAADIALLDRWQRDVPLVRRPYAAMAKAEGLEEAELMARLAALKVRGALSRIGAVVRPHSAGWSTLAAMSVPRGDLERVARVVSDEPGVNHNYAREHRLNLWFVATGAARADVMAMLARIEAAAGLPVVDLPLEQAYHIDLGFPLLEDGRELTRRPRVLAQVASAQDRALLDAVADGLALVPEPFAPLATRLSMAESALRDRLTHLLATGIVTRFGCVVRHRALGFIENAMAVWDVPDDVVDTVAGRISQHRHVTLCYRRPRRIPAWTYNLFCMVHARSRAAALAVIDDLNAIAGAGPFAQDVLFSTRCFTQRGARFAALAGERA